ncbi:sirohydrochlorin chelatase [Paractinoplanes ferrugineus]|uniref:Cobalamin biosynthesis protein CbiX n=1 Tax=Paractinoplanes ferrugineus TaxID=113564 RepID=A0A919MMA0_9ACTN|nr:CbiX/SirB N-terminal domain-containing protein [Actinoplanes ferrugineus]GIE13037.1 cobalamin biosynthesis protein CbiX [Actinoplanes ferrugineus]
MPSTRLTLLAVAHGTRSATGQKQIRDLVAAVARRRPEVDIRLSYADVQQPRIGEVVPTVRAAVVVPLLLSAGFHVRVDIARAVDGTRFPVTAPLGPDDVLLDSLARHLPADADADAVVLAAAGSSDPGWRASVAATARSLGGAHVGYVSGSSPSVAEVVAGLREQGARRIAIAAYLLAEGLFYRTLHRAGADSVTPPLALDPAVVPLVVRRYESALLTTAPARM